jgi:hypothetical protein
MMDLSKAITFIEDTCTLYNIDESHGLNHSLKILRWSLLITRYNKITLRNSQIIQLSCLLHDMCDKKYMDEHKGIQRIRCFLTGIMLISSDIINDILFIISTMSYSKVVKYGYPDFNNNQDLEYCYHVVRNSDLLCGYDPERCIQYQMRCGGTRKEGIEKMLELFKSRVLTQFDDGYINLDSAKKYAIDLHEQALKKLEDYRDELKIYNNNIDIITNDESMDCIS